MAADKTAGAEYDSSCASPAKKGAAERAIEMIDELKPSNFPACNTYFHTFGLIQLHENMIGRALRHQSLASAA